jgi:hypothetical protein
MITRNLDSFPANSNPFHHDHYRMGQDIEGTPFIAMHERSDYVIIINKNTGERVLISETENPHSLTSF